MSKDLDLIWVINKATVIIILSASTKADYREKSCRNVCIYFFRTKVKIQQNILLRVSCAMYYNHTQILFSK